MRTSVIILFIFVFCNHIAVAADISSVPNIFPKAGELRGGDSAWIAGGISKETRGRCEMYENTYTYYSKQAEKIMDIQRNNTYMVSVRVYACENFLTALGEYEKLSATSAEVKKKNMTANVPFGERGILLALPGKDKASQMADFYLTFILRSFVVQVYSNDGFAQMDMAGEIERRLSKYIIGQGASYFINKLNVEAEYGGVKYPSTISFTGDNITTVALTGTVFDSGNRPLPDITVTARETGQKAVTDKFGRYALDVTVGKGKSVALTKMLFLPVAGQAKLRGIATGVYKIETRSGKLRADVLNILTADGRVYGTLSTADGKVSFPVKGTASANGFIFNADCTQPGSSLKCSIVFKGTVSKDKFTGTFAGGGSKGEWTINPSGYVPVTESIYAIDAGLEMHEARVHESGDVSLIKGKGLVLDNTKDRRAIAISVSGELADRLFFRNARLELDIIAADIKGTAEVVLYEADNYGKFNPAKRVSTVASFTKDTVPANISVDISGVLRQRNPNGYIIGIESKKPAAVSVMPTEKSVDMTYYRNVSGYIQRQIVEGKLKTFDGEDIVSNSNALKSDGESDIELEITLSAKGRTLQSIEITAEGDTPRKWNTNSFDIYPLAAFRSGSDVYNSADGAIKYKLTNDIEKFIVNMYRGTLSKENVKRIKVTVVLDGKVYETEFPVQ